MKMSRKEMEEKYSKPIDAADDGPLYPWGLRLNLDDDVVSRLKLKDLPKVGKTMMLAARVGVVSVSSSDSQGGGKRESIELQITDLGLDRDGDDESATEIYDGAQSEK